MFCKSTGFGTDFIGKFESLFGSIMNGFARQQDPGRGPAAKLPATQLLISLVYHVLNGSGVFSEHVLQLFGVSIKDSSLSERRQRMGLEPFAWLMKNALRPLAEKNTDKSCFYKGWRLCGIDGSRWSVTNTPQVLKSMTKASTRRFDAAFAKLEMCVLVELGLHNPLAAEVGIKGECEWTLTARLLESLPQHSLLIMDRLSGCGKYLREIMEACRLRKSEVLVRARANVKCTKIRTLSDGSALVRICPSGKKGGLEEAIDVREIRGRIRKPGAKKWIDVRFWTTLTDERKYPGMELLKLYGFRWEHEIFYKELKINMRGGDVLHSHTPETAAQEVAALLMACAIIAEQRLAVARSGEVEPLSISFVKTLEQMNAFWMILAVSDGLLTETMMQNMFSRVRESIIRQATPPRRKRNCPRKIRQPVGGWPRLSVNESNEGDYTFETISFP
jgi:hypothetical protein